MRFPGSLNKILAAACLFGLSSTAQADEGMWLFNYPPLKQLKQRYSFEPSPAWLAHLQKSTLRFSSGGSGSFISADGLVLSNHHVAEESIQKLNLLEHGFYAAGLQQEVKCPDLEVDLLESIEDVTGRVRAGEAITTLEAASSSGLKSEVVRLFKGANYHLYHYRHFDDVRLVFAPEQSAAFFGGDAENFEYPRFCLDVAFFRLYDKTGRPFKPEHYLRWGAGVQDGEAVVVSGNPASSERLDTYNYLQYLRDLQLPLQIKLLEGQEASLTRVIQRNPGSAREASQERFSVDNARKARLGGLEGLRDEELMKVKSEAEADMRRAISAKPELDKLYSGAWIQVDAAIAELKVGYTRFLLLELGRGLNSRLYEIASLIVRYSAERAKPESQRLFDYGQSQWESIEFDLFSPAPIDKSLETEKLAASLTTLSDTLGAQDPLVAKLLAGRSPAQAASELISGTRLEDPHYRRQLIEMSPAQLQFCQDPMIVAAHEVDPVARVYRKIYEEKVLPPLQRGYDLIIKAQQSLEKEQYPDATFSPRLAFGKISGYSKVPAFTTFQGLYESAKSHLGQAPYALSEPWKHSQSALNLDTPFNFACTVDILAGNSGSPVVNRQGELVGVIFDGNRESLVLDYLYTEQRARALAVDGRAILEALSKVYHCSRLVEEIKGGQHS